MLVDNILKNLSFSAESDLAKAKIIRDIKNIKNSKDQFDQASISNNRSENVSVLDIIEENASYDIDYNKGNIINLLKSSCSN